MLDTWRPKIIRKRKKKKRERKGRREIFGEKERQLEGDLKTTGGKRKNRELRVSSERLGVTAEKKKEQSSDG